MMYETSPASVKRAFRANANECGRVVRVHQGCIKGCSTCSSEWKLNPGKTKSSGLMADEIVSRLGTSRRSDRDQPRFPLLFRLDTGDPGLPGIPQIPIVPVVLSLRGKIQSCDY